MPILVGGVRQVGAEAHWGGGTRGGGPNKRDREQNKSKRQVGHLDLKSTMYGLSEAGFAFGMGARVGQVKGKVKFILPKIQRAQGQSYARELVGHQFAKPPAN